MSAVKKNDVFVYEDETGAKRGSDGVTPFTDPSSPIPTKNGERQIVSSIIANGQSLSNAIDVSAGVLSAIMIPDQLGAAVSLTFQACDTLGGTYEELQQFGSPYEVAIAPNTAYVPLPPLDFLGVGFIKVRAGTEASPVAQSGDKTVKLILS